MLSAINKASKANSNFPAIKAEVTACMTLAKRAKKLVDTKGASMGSLAKGGRVPKTVNYTLHKGEIVMNKTQQARLRNAKTQKSKNKVIADVKRRSPKKPACGRMGGCGGAAKTKHRKRTPAQKKAFEKMLRKSWAVK